MDNKPLDNVPSVFDEDITPLNEQEDVIKDEEPKKEDVEPVKDLPHWAYITIVSVVSIIIVAIVLLVQFSQRVKCDNHVNENGDRFCDICGIIVDRENVSPHSHTYIEGVCVCGFKDVNYVPPVQIDYTSDTTNAAIMLDKMLSGELSNIPKNATFTHITTNGLMVNNLFPEGKPTSICVDEDKTFVEINVQGNRIYKNIWHVDDGTYRSKLSNGEITAEWVPNISVFVITPSFSTTANDLVFDETERCFVVQASYLKNIGGNVLYPVMHMLNKVPGLEDMDYNDLDYELCFKIDENNNLVDLELKGIADSKDVISIIYNNTEGKHQFSLVVKHGVLYQFGFIYNKTSVSSGQFSATIAITPSIEMELKAQDFTFSADAATGDTVVVLDKATETAMTLARESYGKEDAPHTHNYVVTQDNPTCTAIGYLTYNCSCGDIYVETIPATGHNFNEGFCKICKEADPHYVPPELEPEINVDEETLQYLSEKYPLEYDLYHPHGCEYVYLYDDSYEAYILLRKTSTSYQNGNLSYTYVFAGAQLVKTEDYCEVAFKERYFDILCGCNASQIVLKTYPKYTDTYIAESDCENILIYDAEYDAYVLLVCEQLSSYENETKYNYTNAFRTREEAELFLKPYFGDICTGEIQKDTNQIVNLTHGKYHSAINRYGRWTGYKCMSDCDTIAVYDEEFNVYVMFTYNMGWYITNVFESLESVWWEGEYPCCQATADIVNETLTVVTHNDKCSESILNQE